MGKFKTLAGIAVCSAVVAVSPFAAHATTIRSFGPQAQQVHYYANGWIKDDVNGVVYHTPHYMRTVQQQMHMPIRPNACCLLQYGGGPVQEKPHIYLILWGWKKAGDPDHAHPFLLNFAKGVGGTPWLNTDSQYTDHNGPIQNNANQFAGIWADNTKADKIPASPTDGQVAAEAVKSMNKFGFDPFGSYVVATAHGHSIAGFGTQFCAYHSDVNSSKGIISYTNLPYMPDAGGNCGANFVNPGAQGLLDGVSIVEGHELAESQTDPQPFSGWNSNSGEIGDLCAWQGLANQTFSTGVFPTQPLYSNATQTCVQHYP